MRYTVQYIVYSVQYIKYSVQYIVYTVQYIVYTVQYILYSVQYTVYSVQYIVYQRRLGSDRGTQALYRPLLYYHVLYCRLIPYQCVMCSTQAADNKSRERKKKKNGKKEQFADMNSNLLFFQGP